MPDAGTIWEENLHRFGESFARGIMLRQHHEDEQKKELEKFEGKLEGYTQIPGMDGKPLLDPKEFEGIKNHSLRDRVYLEGKTAARIETMLEAQKNVQYIKDAQIRARNAEVKGIVEMAPDEAKIFTLDGKKYRTTKDGQLEPIGGTGPEESVKQMDEFSKMFGEYKDPQTGQTTRHVSPDLFGIDPKMWGEDPNKPGNKVLGLDSQGQPISPDKWSTKDSNKYQQPNKWITLPQGAVEKGQDLFKQATTKTQPGISDTTTITTPSKTARALQSQLPQIKSDEDYAKVKPGQMYFDAVNGIPRRKPDQQTP